MAEEVKLIFRYEQDSKRFHRFKIVDPDGKVTGSIYIPKDMKPIPSKLLLERDNN